METQFFTCHPREEPALEFSSRGRGSRDAEYINPENYFEFDKNPVFAVVNGKCGYWCKWVVYQQLDTRLRGYDE